MNAAWHREHVLGRNATLAERVAWHREHRSACGCRPPPASVIAHLDAKAPMSRASTGRAAAAAAPSKRRAESADDGRSGEQGAGKKRTSKARARQAPPRARRAVGAQSSSPAKRSSSAERGFARIVEEVSGEPGVSYGGKGFGSRGLKANGKLFAMLTPRAELVAKLPRARATELIAAGNAVPFQAGRGRVMAEWVVLVRGGVASWTRFVREALIHVRGR